MAAAREVEEETGWRPAAPEFLLTFQPAIGSADAPQDLYVARGAELARWVPVDEALAMIAGGEILGTATVIGVMHAAAMRTGAPPHTP